MQQTAYFSILFVRVYFTTPVRTPIEHFKAMFTGCEEEPEHGR